MWGLLRGVLAFLTTGGRKPPKHRYRCVRVRDVETGEMRWEVTDRARR